MRRSNCPKVIVFGNGLYNTLGLVRSVGECGIPVTLILEPGGKVDNPVRFSRYVERIHDLASLDEGVEVLKRDYWDCPVRSVVLCGSDPSVCLLDRRYDELKERFLIFNAKTAGRINYFMDKVNTFPLVGGKGISLIRTWRLQGGAPVPVEIPYPCLVKGNNSLTSTKADMFVCRDVHELLSNVRVGVDYLVQEYIEKEYELDIVGLSMNNGRDVFIPAVVRKLRDDLHRQSVYIRLDDVSQYSDLDVKGIRTFMGKLGYEGIFSVELIKSAGRYYFLEVNLRNDACGYLYTAAGINYPKLWVDYCSGTLTNETLEKVSFKHPYRLMSLYDIYNVIEGKVPVGKWVRECFSVDAHFVMNARDPMPFLVSSLIHVRQAFKKLFRKAFRQQSICVR